MQQQQFRPPLPVGPRLVQPQVGQQQQLRPVGPQQMDNRMRMMLQQRQLQLQQVEGRPQTSSPLLAQQLAGPATSQPSPTLTSVQLKAEEQQQQQQGGGETGGGGGGGLDALDGGELDANLGMGDDDLLGDFGDDFNILEFADALDSSDTSKTNILDDLEAEDDEKKGDGEKKDKQETPKTTTGQEPPPYTGQFPPGDTSRGPPPPYPGHAGNKVRTEAACHSFL